MISFFTKEKVSENKKRMENLVLILVLFIIVIVVMNVLREESTAKVNSTGTNHSEITVEKVENEKSLEEKLEAILSLVEGAGKVEVLITYQTGIKQIPMYDWKQSTVVTEEADKAGGTRKTEETSQEQSVIFEENGNTKVPVIQQTMNPEIVGVLVVAEGAAQLSVKEKLMKAVEATLNVPSHRIQVLERKK